ncbi:hypothetical protein KSP39_PZI003223 [Platanthera zijinensis]|uniref:Uncharacterized protein n=1 Tax=Platanthera zijinensis TaxID=2320716 RepID=A0AAP0BVA1_9ASPA
MWRRSASFVLDKRPSPLPGQQSFRPCDGMEPQNPNPNPNTSHEISAYYQTRSEHHAVVTSDWLAQAQAAVTLNVTQPDVSSKLVDTEKPFSVIDEFNYWRKNPDLAEAVAAIMALAAFIRSCDATTMMELEIELKKAADTLKRRCKKIH